MTIHEFHKGMREHFGIDKPGDFLDELYLLQKKVKIDLVKFDRWLTSQHGYSPANWSMGDEVEQKFGVEAKHFIMKLL